MDVLHSEHKSVAVSVDHCNLHALHTSKGQQNSATWGRDWIDLLSDNKSQERSIGFILPKQVVETSKSFQLAQWKILENLLNIYQFLYVIHLHIYKYINT